MHASRPWHGRGALRPISDHPVWTAVGSISKCASSVREYERILWNVDISHWDERTPVVGLQLVKEENRKLPLLGPETENFDEKPTLAILLYTYYIHASLSGLILLLMTRFLSKAVSYSVWVIFVEDSPLNSLGVFYFIIHALDKRFTTCYAVAAAALIGNWTGNKNKGLRSGSLSVIKFCGRSHRRSSRINRWTSDVPFRC